MHSVSFENYPLTPLPSPSFISYIYQYSFIDNGLKTLQLILRLANLISTSPAVFHLISHVDQKQPSTFFVCYTSLQSACRVFFYLLIILLKNSVTAHDIFLSIMSREIMYTHCTSMHLKLYLYALAKMCFSRIYKRIILGIAFIQNA